MYATEFIPQVKEAGFGQTVRLIFKKGYRSISGVHLLAKHCKGVVRVAEEDLPRFKTALDNGWQKEASRTFDVVNLSLLNESTLTSLARDVENVALL